MKLEELSIADLKALSDFACKKWEKAIEIYDPTDTEKWAKIDFKCREELLKRITEIFKP